MKLRHKIDEFSTLEGAKRWANNCNKLHLVVLGDNDKFWVVCGSDFQTLIKNGYEAS